MINVDWLWTVRDYAHEATGEAMSTGRHIKRWDLDRLV